MRKENFVTGEFYHIYNRGVDKRNIFADEDDMDRFLQSMEEFNTLDPIGSIYENSFRHRLGRRLGRPTSKYRARKKLVEFICYCLNPNHFHFVLKQLVDNGISEFMKRMGGYTKYFNEKRHRSGALFQGRFKSKYISDNVYLLHVSAYVNLNFRVHKLSLGRPTSKWGVGSRTSWGQYINDGKMKNRKFIVCDTDIVLGQFKNSTDYRKFAESTVEETSRRRESDKLPVDLLE